MTATEKDPSPAENVLPPNANISQDRRWWVLAIVGTAQLMTVLDVTIVNIALPSAQRDLGFSDGDREWVITAYSLAFASLLLLGGRLADLLGRKTTFLVGSAGFAVASAVAGAAPNFGTLVAGRALQGAFGALLAPSVLALLNTAFASDPKARTKAFGIMGAITGTGGAIGLLLGGVLTEHLNWRWTLYINLVFVAIALIGGMLLLPRTGRDNRARLDLVGAALVSAGLFAIVFGLSSADDHGWSSFRTWGDTVGGVLLVVLFLAWQARASHPLLPLGTLKDRNRIASLAGMLIAGCGSYGVFLFLTYYMQVTLGYSPVKTGVVFLPLIGCLVISAQISTTVTLNRYGPRVAVSIGMVLNAVGLAWLAGVGLEDDYAGTVLGPLLLIGLGLGQMLPAVMSGATEAAPRAHVGAVSATVTTMQQMGGAIGTALLNTVATSTTSDYLDDHPSHTTMVLANARLEGFTSTFWLAAVLFAAGTVVSLVLYRRRPAATS